MKDIIEDVIKAKHPMTISMPGKKVMENNLLRADKIEYLHNTGEDEMFGDIFDHHLMFYLKKELIFKMWLPNSSKSKEFKDVRDALNNMGVKVRELRI